MRTTCLVSRQVAAGEEEEERANGPARVCLHVRVFTRVRACIRDDCR